MKKKIKVLIIEDSKLMQDILSTILRSETNIDVVGIANDPLIARELIKKHQPDVLTLDIMLPHMDGITFLKNLMRLRPTPVVMISTLTEKGSALGLEALAIGAVDYIAKPTADKFDDLSDFAHAVITAVITAAQTNVSKNVIEEYNSKKFQRLMSGSKKLKDEIIAIGASTGGIEAIETILFQLPLVLPPIVIVQHIKKEFNLSFINRIKRLYGLSVVETENQLEITPGNIYIAPASQHLLIKRSPRGYVACLEDTKAVSGHKPSVDVLFHSVAQAAGTKAIGVLLTGMGADGAEGLKAIRDAGGSTIAQDEESSIVWGMPGSAVKLGAVEHVVPLLNIPQKILQIIDNMALTEKSS